MTVNLQRMWLPAMTDALISGRRSSQRSSYRSSCSGIAAARATAVARFVHATLTAELPPGWHTQPDHLHHCE